MDVNQALEIIQVLHQEGAMSVGNYEEQKKEIEGLITTSKSRETTPTSSPSSSPQSSPRSGRHRKAFSCNEDKFVKQLWQIKDVPRIEEDVLAYMKLLQKQKKLVPVMTGIIQEEIEGNKVGILREESIGASMLKNFWFHYEGTAYLKTLVKPLIAWVENKTKHKSLEVDPSLVDEDKLQMNIKLIIKGTEDFLENLFSSVPMFPRTSRSLLRNFYEVLSELEGLKTRHLSLGYSEAALQLFGGFFLLRFICPAIVCPQKFGIVKELSPNAQRTLVFISKVVQAIGNQAEFGEKEFFMTPFNEFILRRMPKMMNFIHQLTAIVPSKIVTLL